MLGSAAAGSHGRGADAVGGAPRRAVSTEQDASGEDAARRGLRARPLRARAVALLEPGHCRSGPPPPLRRARVRRRALARGGWSGRRGSCRPIACRRQRYDDGPALRKQLSRGAGHRLRALHFAPVAARRRLPPAAAGQRRRLTRKPVVRALAECVARVVWRIGTRTQPAAATAAPGGPVRSARLEPVSVPALWRLLAESPDGPRGAQRVESECVPEADGQSA